MQKSKNIILGLLCAMIPNQIWASGAGSTGGDFLKLGVGARPEAMGEAYLALADDSSGFYWNPAGLTQVQLPEVSIMHLSYLADINYESLGTVMPIFGQNIGLGLTWLNVAPFNSTLDPSAEQGSASGYTVTGAYAFALSRQLSLGANAKILASNLAGENSIGGAADLGLLFKPFGREFAFALVAQNLGLSSAYEQSSDPLPISLRLGAAWRLYRHGSENFANLIMDINKSIDDRFQYNVGAEGWLYDTLALRAGYKFSEGGNDLGGLANFTAGLGLKLGAANIDYAFVPLGELGATHRISASWKFGYSPVHVAMDSLLGSTPKISKLGDGINYGVSFDIKAEKALNGEALREWRLDINDAEGHTVKTLSGEGDTPKMLAWDLRNEKGERMDPTHAYKFDLLLRKASGGAIETDGAIAQEIRPKEMMMTAPKFDSATGSLVFQPKTSFNAGVKEWKVTATFTKKNGELVKLFKTGTGAIPKNLVWNTAELGNAGGNLAASKQINAIKYDLEFKDATGQSKMVSDQVRLIPNASLIQSYRLPLPVKEFKVNKGHEVLVASLPSLTSSDVQQAGAAPFVMAAPAQGHVRNWRFEITDAKGNLVKTYKGDSEIPETIFWDGLNEQGIPVDNAEKARFSFWVIDQNGKESSTDVRKVIRNPFTLRGAQGKVRKISGLWFRFEDSDVQDAIVVKLRDIAQSIRKNPNVQVTIQGHSWNEGSPEESLRLSQDRADAVLRFLIEDEGISPRNVSSIGYGNSMPLVAGNSDEAAARNRRVEIVIISK